MQEPQKRPSRNELREAVELARRPSPWDLGNEVLYDMCRRHPLHRDDQAVVAKLWIIGRTYAASIERRRGDATAGVIGNEDFYTKFVTKEIRTSGFDEWISAARRIGHPTAGNLPKILEIHWQVTQLFRTISKLGKRSLASKYLHFHVPGVFYIYDKRAVDALCRLSPLIGAANRVAVVCADEEYRKFALRCLALDALVEETTGIRLTPRQLDNVLLYGPVGEGWPHVI